MLKPIVTLLVLLAALSVHGACSAQPDAREQPAPPSAVPADNVPQLFELPWEVRRDLPELKLTVFTVGDNPDQRFAKINGEIFNEGDNVEGIRVVAIREDGVICEFEGQRFLIK